MKAYKNPTVTVDAIVRNKNKLLLIQRLKEPFKGKWAFPGGHLDYGEDPVTAVLRELREETNLIGDNTKLAGVYGDPKRDPRGHYVTIVYNVDVKDVTPIQAGDDAGKAEFFDIDTLTSQGSDLFAFDHFTIFKECVLEKKD